MRRLLFVVLTVVAGAAFGARPAPVPSLEGKMTQVIDGATFVLQTADGKSITVRLVGIEPPEPCQTWGNESRDALKDWLTGETVAIKTQGKDTQGRMQAHVLLDGADLSQRMVEEGHAFSTRTNWDRGPYVKEERVAHSLARGMFGTGARIEKPVDFRRSHAPCAAPAGG